MNESRRGWSFFRHALFIATGLMVIVVAGCATYSSSSNCFEESKATKSATKANIAALLSIVARQQALKPAKNARELGDPSRLRSQSDLGTQSVILEEQAKQGWKDSDKQALAERTECRILRAMKSARTPTDTMPTAQGCLAPTRISQNSAKGQAGMQDRIRRKYELAERVVNRCSVLVQVLVTEHKCSGPNMDCGGRIDFPEVINVEAGATTVFYAWLPDDLSKEAKDSISTEVTSTTTFRKTRVVCLGYTRYMYSPRGVDPESYGCVAPP